MRSRGFVARFSVIPFGGDHNVSRVSMAIDRFITLLLCVRFGLLRMLPRLQRPHGKPAFGREVGNRGNAPPDPGGTYRRTVRVWTVRPTLLLQEPILPLLRTGAPEDLAGLSVRLRVRCSPQMSEGDRCSRSLGGERSSSSQSQRSWTARRR